MDLGDFAIFTQCFTGQNPEGCIGASASCGEALGGESSGASESASETPNVLPLEILLEDPAIAELYEALQAHCEAEGIPCT